MQMMRRVLLASSQSRWLRDRAPHYRFVRKAAARFMPGENLEEALAAAGALRDQGAGSILTQLGENLGKAEEADEVVVHYLGALDRVGALGLDAEISVKPTQLGLDFDPDRCLAHLRQLAERAAAHRNFIWIDMEGSAYTARTLDLYRRVRAQYRNVGVALQSYLYRTAQDLLELLPLGPAIRLVKGAYHEPPQLAYPRKRDVDENFFLLAQQLLQADAQQKGTRAAFGTHDLRLIQRIEKAAADASVAKDKVEFQLLFGIQRGEQARLAQAGYPVRVLVSYGSQWFPWFMRRLAERPANLGFLMRNLFSG